MNLPFDPWTATEEEAISEDQARKGIKEQLSAEIRKHEFGSDQWRELQYRLAPICINAARQRTAAIRIKKYRDKADRLSELKLLGIIREVMSFKLIAPDWLTGEFFLRLTPIALGQKANFKHWTTGGSYKNRRKWAECLQVRLYKIVNELLTEKDEKGRQRYTKSRLEVENNVWEPAAAIIEAEFKSIQKKFSYGGSLAKKDYAIISKIVKLMA